MMHYRYQAGISDKNDNWVWQGYIVANNVTHAKKLLKIFKKKKSWDSRYSINIRSDSRVKTTDKIGVKTI